MNRTAAQSSDGQRAAVLLSIRQTTTSFPGSRPTLQQGAEQNVFSDCSRENRFKELFLTNFGWFTRKRREYWMNKYTVCINQLVSWIVSCYMLFNLNHYKDLTSNARDKIFVKYELLL